MRPLARQAQERGPGPAAPAGPGPLKGVPRTSIGRNTPDLEPGFSRSSAELRSELRARLDGAACRGGEGLVGNADAPRTRPSAPPTAGSRATSDASASLHGDDERLAVPLDAAGLPHGAVAAEAHGRVLDGDLGREVTLVTVRPARLDLGDGLPGGVLLLLDDDVRGALAPLVLSTVPPSVTSLFRAASPGPLRVTSGAMAPASTVGASTTTRNTIKARTTAGAAALLISTPLARSQALWRGPPDRRCRCGGPLPSLK